MMTTDSLPSLAVIYAGGTFGSFGKPLQALPAKVFIPVLSDILTQHFSSYQPMLKWCLLDNEVIEDSSQLDSADFAHFYQLVLTNFQKGIQRFVILTGTDTLSYLSSFLAEAFAGSDIRIVVTGAMQPLLDVTQVHDYQIDMTSDATENLFQACRLAAYGQAGVWVCFQGEAWHAQTVQKLHSHDVMAFTGHHSVGYPALSYQEHMSKAKQRHWIEDRIARLPMMLKQLDASKIVTLYFVPSKVEVLARQLEGLLALYPDAIILIGFGAGNIPHHFEIQRLFMQAYHQKCLIVMTTQCPFGGVSDDYEAGAWTSDYHILPTGRLTISAIFARLLWLQAFYDDVSHRRQRWSACLKICSS